ncbi:MAG: M56 family metallopeptidase [Planctomycetales bacterium]
MIDDLSIWAINVLLQVTIASTLGLVITACFRRNSAAKYWVLCSALVLMLISPLLVIASQRSGWNFVSVELPWAAAASSIELPETPGVEEHDDSQRTEYEILATTASAEIDSEVDSIRDGESAGEWLRPDPIMQQEDPTSTMRTRANSLPERLAANSIIQDGDEATQSESDEQSVFVNAVQLAMTLLLSVWLVGATFVSVRLVTGSLRLRRILRSAKPNRDRSLEELFGQVVTKLGLLRRPELVLSDEVSGPMSAGLIRPRVILPTDLAEHVSATHLHDVLVHEVAHILRHDPLTVLLQNVAGTLYWLHPVVNWHNRALGQAREEICDNYVLATTNAPAYARTLLTLAELVQTSSSMPGAVGLFTSGWKLENRVADLLDEQRNRMVKLTSRARLLIVLLSLAMISVAACGTVTVATGQEAAQPSQLSNGDTGADDEPAVETQESETQDAQPMTSPVMRGEGARREMLLRGRVRDTSGQPAREFDVIVSVKKKAGRQAVAATVNGSQFEVWIPIVGSHWFYLEVSASAKDGKSRAFEGISNRELRTACIDGIDLQFASVDREVEISVTKNDVLIPGAHVTAEIQGNSIRHGETNDTGTVTFRLLDDEEIRQITAWTDDYKIGGYLFKRKPRRDPLASKFIVELDDCRPQKFRFVSEVDDSPVPDVEFQLSIGTGAPNYNYPAIPGTFPHARMVTNEQGEATCRWFPDWEKHGSYVEIIDPRWAKDAEDLTTAIDGALVMTLKPRVQRRALTGQVVSDGVDVGGLMVCVESFQAEEESQVDRRYGFTDGDGMFAVDSIPGATYCAFVDDPKLTGNIVDLIPFEPETGKSNIARLEVSEGAPVEVLVTSGPSRRPMNNQRVYCTVRHEFSWLEDGEEHSGVGGPGWGVQTDGNGVARIRVQVGSELRVNVYAGEWRSEEKRVTVKAGEVTTIKFHRKVDGEREVKGILIPPPDVDVANAEIVYGSIDGETDEEHSIKADSRGRFAFKTKAIQLGIFAYTVDGKAAGIARLNGSDGSFELNLKRTRDLHGQLLGKDDLPMRHHPVRVRAVIRGKRDFRKSFSSRFVGKTFETMTNSDGHYTLKNLPVELDMTLQTDPVEGSEYEPSLGGFFLRTERARPLMISRLNPVAGKSVTRPLSDRYSRVLRDSTLGDFHLLVLIYESAVKEFVNDKLLDYEITKDVGSFMNLRITEGDMTNDQTKAFVASKNWPEPEQDKVFLVAVNAAGQKLGQVDLKIDAPDAASEAAEFISAHAPAQADARKKWDAAFAEAKRSGRKVWARIGQRYCGPCFSMSRWLDDNRELLEQDYVLLKIDNVRDEHGVEITKRIVSDREHFGVPFHAIFDADQKLLIDSDGPTGNIGHPSGFEGLNHVEKMLDESRTNLSDAQIRQVVTTLELK